MTERVRFKSRGSHQVVAIWEVIKDGARSVDIRNVDTGRVLSSVNRDRLVTVTEQESND